MFFELQNFGLGLDTRRSELTTKPGALETLENAHINQGGEIEKRKAFVSLGALPDGVVDGTYGTWSTWGLQEGIGTIYVFGSVPVAKVVAWGNLPTGVSYLQCEHPAVTYGAAYDATKHLMTGVKSSTLFSNSPFVVAQFIDGTSWSYYQFVGSKMTVATDFTSGLVLSGLTSNNQVAARINAELDLSLTYTDSTVAGPVVDVIGPVGADYTYDDTVTSTLGTLTDVHKNAAIDPVAGSPAVGQFTIVAGTGGTVTKVEIYNGAVLVQSLLNGGTAVPFNTSVYQTAIDVAVSITAKAGSAFNATANNGTVLIYSNSSVTTYNSNYVQVTVTDDICVGNCVVPLSGDPTGGFATAANGGSIVFGSGSNCITSTGVGISSATLPIMATALATFIKASSTAAAYTACAVGNSVYLAKLVTSSADASVVVSMATGTALVLGSQAAAGLVLSTTVNALTVTGTTQATCTTGPVAVILTGQIASSYTYKWSVKSLTVKPTPKGATLSTDITALSITSDTSASTTFFVRKAYIDWVHIGGLLAGWYKAVIVAQVICTVTDNNTNVYTTVPLSVTININ